LKDIGQPVVEPGPLSFMEGDEGEEEEANPALSIPLLVPPARPSSPVDNVEKKTDIQSNPS
jgi:hypothetical protein